ncbi:MAG: hypothetical protein AAFY88_18090 [Acidobacteriota bacterium]
MSRHMHGAIVAMACLLVALPSWARQGEAPYSFNKASLSGQSVAALQLLGVDAPALLAEDAARFTDEILLEAGCVLGEKRRGVDTE